MDKEMMKSLVALIDESLAEIEELKKSDRFSASEIKLGDDSSNVDGRDKNGSMGKEEAAKADDVDDDDDDDKEDKKDDDKDMDKAEGKNSEADPNAGHHKVVKEEAAKADEAEKAEDDMDKADGKNSEADPNAGHHKVAKSNDKAFAEELKKSREETEQLIKSYIDDKFGGLEKKFETLVSMVKDIADSPVPSKGASYKSVQPLKKSADEGEVLSKSQIVNKLFDLKKSGEKVDSVDIASVELGGPGELARIVNKYNIK